MVKVTVWHRPESPASCEALRILEGYGLDLQVVSVAEQPPPLPELERVHQLLGLPVREWLRKKAAAYGELGVSDPSVTDADLLAAMAADPALIQCPILLRGERALLARPALRAIEILRPDGEPLPLHEVLRRARD